MQALLVLVFAAGLVLFGMSRFDFSPDEINSMVKEVLNEQTQTREMEKPVVQTPPTAIEIEDQSEQMVSKQQAEDYSKMKSPIAPSVDMILQDQKTISGEQMITSEETDSATGLQAVAHAREYQNKYTLDDVFHVNQNTDELLQQYDALKKLY